MAQRGWSGELLTSVLGLVHGWDSAILSSEGLTDHFESVMKDKKLLLRNIHTG